MLEPVIGILLLGLLLVCVHRNVIMIREMSRDTYTEQRAVTVLGNVVERLAAEAGVTDVTVVRQIFSEELQASELVQVSEIESSCKNVGREVVLRIGRSSGRKLAEIRIAIHE